MSSHQYLVQHVRSQVTYSDSNPITYDFYHFTTELYSATDELVTITDQLGLIVSASVNNQSTSTETWQTFTYQF